MMVLEGLHHLRKGHVVLAFEVLDKAIKLDDDEKTEVKNDLG